MTAHSVSLVLFLQCLLLHHPSLCHSFGKDINIVIKQFTVHFDVHIWMAISAIR